MNQGDHLNEAFLNRKSPLGKSDFVVVVVKIGIVFHKERLS